MENGVDLTGTWHSRYEYGRGVQDEIYASEHRIRFGLVSGKWVGESLPNADGSEVVLTLRKSGNENEFAGEWRERTSPTGYYRRREFHGVILFLLQKGGTELDGMWLGAGSTSGRVKSGIWVLKRERQ